MSKIKEFFGIDISKDVFDVDDPLGKHHQFKNDLSGFKAFGKLLNENSHCVMEVTGSYYQGLATWLCFQSFDVSVVNPLSVKRFIQKACFDCCSKQATEAIFGDSQIGIVL